LEAVYALPQRSAFSPAVELVNTTRPKPPIPRVCGGLDLICRFHLCDSQNANSKDGRKQIGHYGREILCGTLAARFGQSFVLVPT
jgi:hypothetical protein